MEEKEVSDGQDSCTFVGSVEFGGKASAECGLALGAIVLDKQPVESSEDVITLHADMNDIAQGLCALQVEIAALSGVNDETFFVLVETGGRTGGVGGWPMSPGSSREFAWLPPGQCTLTVFDAKGIIGREVAILTTGDRRTLRIDSLGDRGSVSVDIVESPGGGQWARGVVLEKVDAPPGKQWDETVPEDACYADHTRYTEDVGVDGRVRFARIPVGMYRCMALCNTGNVRVCQLVSVSANQDVAVTLESGGAASVVFRFGQCVSPVDRYRVLKRDGTLVCTVYPACDEAGAIQTTCVRIDIDPGEYVVDEIRGGLHMWRGNLVVHADGADAVVRGLATR